MDVGFELKGQTSDAPKNIQGVFSNKLTKDQWTCISRCATTGECSARSFDSRAAAEDDFHGAEDREAAVFTPSGALWDATWFHYDDGEELLRRTEKMGGRQRIYSKNLRSDSSGGSNENDESVVEECKAIAGSIGIGTGMKHRKWLAQLKRGDILDFLDNHGKWRSSRVICDGFPSSDSAIAICLRGVGLPGEEVIEYCDRRIDAVRLQPPYTRCDNWRMRLCVGDRIQYVASSRATSWSEATVVQSRGDILYLDGQRCGWHRESDGLRMVGGDIPA
jgi:hypothetical protein